MESIFTLGPELGQLLAEGVLGLFQLPPLLFHVLHVVCQRFDLGFVLWVRKQIGRKGECLVPGFPGHLQLSHRRRQVRDLTMEWLVLCPLFPDAANQSLPCFPSSW